MTVCDHFVFKSPVLSVFPQNQVLVSGEFASVVLFNLVQSSFYIGTGLARYSIVHL